VETSYGEDAASRGRILLFEVDYVPCRRKSRSGGKGRGVGHAPRFTLTHAKKVRGAVSQCAQVMEHIIVSVANRVEVYSVEGKEMKQIATHHAPHYVVRVSVEVDLELARGAWRSGLGGRATSYPGMTAVGGRLSMFEAGAGRSVALEAFRFLRPRSGLHATAAPRRRRRDPTRAYAPRE
jgi:hypothetical protein